MKYVRSVWRVLNTYGASPAPLAETLTWCVNV